MYALLSMVIIHKTMSILQNHVIHVDSSFNFYKLQLRCYVYDILRDECHEKSSNSQTSNMKGSI